MTLNNTVDDMLSHDYKDRFRAEYYQLEIRLQKLTDMVKKYEAGTLDFKPACSLSLLQQQVEVMEAYKDILKTRAALEDIEIY